MRKHEFYNEEEAIDFAHWVIGDPFTYTSVEYHVMDGEDIVFEAKLWRKPDNSKKETHRRLYDAYKRKYENE